MKKSNIPSQGVYTLESVHHKSGGIFASVVNIVLDVVAPPAGMAMHAAMGAYQASQGNWLGAVGNAVGAYGAGGGFSDGGFGSTFGDAASSAGNNMISDFDVGMAESMGSSGGGGSWGIDADNYWNPSEGGYDPSSYGYNLGGDMFSPSDLPFNQSGYDISGANTGAESFTPGNSSLESAYQTGNTGLNYSNMDSSAYNSIPNPEGSGLSNIMSPGPEGTLQSTMATTDAGGAGVDLSSGNNMTSDFDAGMAKSPTSGGIPKDWGTPTNAENINYSTQGGQSTPNMNMSTTSPSLTDKLMSGTAKPSLWDQITSGAGKLGDKFMANPIPNSIKAGGTLYGMYNQNNAANMLKSAASQQDPFGPQRAEYQRLLSQSYQDPMAIYNSPQYQGLNSIFQKQTAARDAAMGRNSQYGARAAEAQTNFMKYLEDYRKNLLTSSGAGIAPTGAATLMSGAAQQYKNMGDTFMGGLNSIFGSPSY